MGGLVDGGGWPLLAQSAVSASPRSTHHLRGRLRQEEAAQAAVLWLARVSVVLGPHVPITADMEKTKGGPFRIRSYLQSRE